MDPLSMERAMINNMVERTGKPLNKWLELLMSKEFKRHSDIVSFLKNSYSITHGYANLIARRLKRKYL